MTITALPTPPSRSSPSTFSERADAFLAALPTFVNEVNAVAAAMDLNDVAATSTTSLAIGTGSKTLTVETGKSFQPGMSVKIAYTADPTNWMHGDVISYNAGTGELVANVTAILGSGTQTAWTVSLSAPGMGGSAFVQMQHASISSVVSGSTTMPQDDTVPQKTEGFEVLTCAITPKDVSNLLLIVFSSGQIGNFADPFTGGVALFQDDTAGALAAIHIPRYTAPVLVHKMAAGTTSETTFKIRVGAHAAGTVYVNAIFGGTTRMFGGVASTTLTIFEIAP